MQKLVNVHLLTETKSKSQSEQPATCPICSATIRQSRNLRRHLELRHFKKRTPKKLKKGMSGKYSFHSNVNDCRKKFGKIAVILPTHSIIVLNEKNLKVKNY